MQGVQFPAPVSTRQLGLRSGLLIKMTPYGVPGSVSPTSTWSASSLQLRRPTSRPAWRSESSVSRSGLSLFLAAQCWQVVQMGPPGLPQAYLGDGLPASGENAGPQGAIRAMDEFWWGIWSAVPRATELAIGIA